MISVIIPVYNAERYIRRCIESLLSQVYQEYELLLIDDGSTDSSGTICDYYSEIDTRVRVFHKENGGVSSARNLGLDNFRGEWVAFVDADDYVDNDYLTIPEKYANCDVVQKGYRRVSEDRNKTSSVIAQPEGIIANRRDLDKFLVNHHTYALWNKIFRSTLIEGARFNIGISVGEDFEFFLHFVSGIKKYGFSNVGCYYYNVRTNSAMKKFRTDEMDRLAIELENLHHVEALLNDMENEKLRNGFIYGTYVPLLMNHYYLMNPSQIKIIDALMQDWNLKVLNILSLKKIVKFSMGYMKYKFIA